MKYFLIRLPELDEDLETLNLLIDRIEENIDINKTDIKVPLDKRFIKIKTSEDSMEEFVENLLITFSLNYDVPFIYEMWDNNSPYFCTIIKGFAEKSYIIPLFNPEHIWKL